MCKLLAVEKQDCLNNSAKVASDISFKHHVSISQGEKNPNL